jgi:hypothetical protein
MGGTPRTERIGVARFDGFFSRVGWLFREQFPSDYGIDAQVEIADGDNATGALIGMQIKAGRSYFSEQVDEAIIFRSNDKHIKYWIGHHLPVIVILRDDIKDILYWQVISEETIQTHR